MSYYTLLIIYILGGLTFFPLLVAIAVAYAYYTSLPFRSSTPPSPHPNASNNASLNLHPSSLKSWLTVRRTFEPSPSSYIALVRTLLDSRSAHPRRAEDAFFAVLKGKVLYLYEDEHTSECAAVIDVGRCRVVISPEGDLLDGELFTKRNAVMLRETKRGEIDNSEEEPWFLFFRSVTSMEDWYLALLTASSDLPQETFAPFPHTAHQLLISSLDALPDLIPTRWLNALLGRLFLGVKGTKALEQWVLGRLMKKLNKVKTPSWLTEIVVRSFDAGDVAPVLSKPMLKELTPEGEASVGIDVSYVAPADGGIRITLSATATISLPATPSLSSLFKSNAAAKDKDVAKEKPYEVSLVLAVIVKRIEGNLLVKIKRPPSNRLWYAFTTMPRLDVQVVPVVSDRQIRWGMVLSGIEGKLREIIQESVVMPHMDDVPFFDSTPYPLRGGIFADAFAAPSFEHPSEEHTSATTEDKRGGPSEKKEEVNVVHRGHSAEVLVQEVGQSKNPQPEPAPDSDAVLRADTIGPGAQAGTRRRKSWFSGSRSGEDIYDEDEHRRRRSEEGPGVHVLVTEDESKDPSHEEVLPLRSNASRSVSESVPLTRSSSKGLSTSAPSTPPPATFSSSTASPPGFLSTLKSGMVEKQPALKEAMRKWGVNWGAGLRKSGAREGGSSHTKEDSGSTCGRNSIDDGDIFEADHDEEWRGRSTSPRGSYADLRRKVEEREKDRERLKNTNPGSKPIDIPGPSSRRASGASSSVAPSIRMSPPASFLSPTAPKTTTELHTTQRATSPAPMQPTTVHTPARQPSADAQPDKTTSVSTLNAPAPTTPIRAQPPKAATMMIPGIHARHRGEVMGFGSDVEVVPQTQAQTQTQATAMQTVYKLFKGSKATVDRQQETTKPTPPPLPPRSIPTGDDSATPSARLSPASQALKTVADLDAARQVPPLPARRASGSLVPSPSAEETVFGLPQEVEAGRLEGTVRMPNEGLKPPLPPRPSSTKVNEPPGVT